VIGSAGRYEEEAVTGRIDEEYERVVPEAWALGYEPLECQCRGTGILVTRSVQCRDGEKITDPCPGCKGSGRWWARRGRPEIRVRLTDAKMLEMIDRERAAATPTR
jgi:hypothetical protein